MRIAMTGATGFIDRHLARHLAARGDTLNVLTRNPAKATGIPGMAKAFKWAGVGSPMPADAFYSTDAVISLAGETVVGRFTATHERKVFDSRVQGTRALVDAIAELDKKPKVLVSGSGAGYYGDRADEVLTEESSRGQGFLPDVCDAWEDEARRAEALNLRVAVIRTGIVLGPDGGALQQMLPPFKLGLGGPIGNGKWFMPWIHIDDLCRLFIHALTEGRQPVYNGSAPEPVTNKEFTRTLGKTLHRPTLFRVPSLGLRLALGESGQAALMQSDRAVPAAALKEGFLFAHPHLAEALQEVLK